MDNHVHLLLEVPPMKVGGLSDEELLKRLEAIYGEAAVAEVAKELREARQKVRDGLTNEILVRKGMQKAAVDAEMDRLQRCRDVAIGNMLRCRVRYFTDGAVIGSRGFVDEEFRRCRDRSGGKRNDVARKLRGNAAAAAGTLWSVRDLRMGIG